MKPINFMDQEKDLDIKRAITAMVIIGHLQEEIKLECEGRGYYFPDDQFKAFEQLINISVDLDIGDRKHEQEKIVTKTAQFINFTSMPWIAMDADGEWYAYQIEPIINLIDEEWDADTRKEHTNPLESLGIFSNTQGIDWKQSKQKIQ